MTASTASPDEPGHTSPARPDRITTTTRDPEEVGRTLATWLGGVLPEGSRPEVSDVVSPEGNGMSSETVLFTVGWNDGDDPQARACAARLEPPTSAHPVFTTYDLGLQYRVMRLVRAATVVPVPEPLWYEGDRTVLGGTFFVMARVDGRVPPDVLPYTFGDNWVFDATPDERRRLQRSAISALAGIHTITPANHDLSFLEVDQPGVTSLERHLAHWGDYHRWVVGDEPSPLLDECFHWLDRHRPTSPDQPALSWGDARIGNMMFTGTDVRAVLDWEMAGVAPPEVDLGWMCYLHMFFQDLATGLGAPGLPDMFRPADVATTYAELGGRPPDDLRWYVAYAAIRHGVIMRRVTERSIFFGDADRPTDIDDLIMHRGTLEEMLEGSYWGSRGL